MTPPRRWPDRETTIANAQEGILDDTTAFVPPFALEEWEILGAEPGTTTTQTARNEPRERALPAGGVPGRSRTPADAEVRQLVRLRLEAIAVQERQAGKSRWRQRLRVAATGAGFIGSAVTELVRVLLSGPKMG